MKNTWEGKSEEELWKHYKKSGDPKIRDYFIKQYAPLVKYVAGKVAIGMPHNVEFDDLVGFGVFGLIDAIEKFDPSKHVKFKTYAVTRIRGSIFDELRSIDWVPRSVRQKTRELENTIEYALHLTDDGQTIKDEQLPKKFLSVTETSGMPQNFISIDEYSKRTIIALQNNHTEEQIAAILGISRKNLWEKRKRWGIPRVTGTD